MANSSQAGKLWKAVMATVHGDDWVALLQEQQTAAILAEAEAEDEEEQNDWEEMPTTNRKNVRHIKYKESEGWDGKGV